MKPSVLAAISTGFSAGEDAIEPRLIEHAVIPKLSKDRLDVVFFIQAAFAFHRFSSLDTALIDVA